MVAQGYEVLTPRAMGACEPVLDCPFARARPAHNRLDCLMIRAEFGAKCLCDR